MRSVGQSALTLVGLFVITLGPLSFAADSAAGDIVFNRDIRPILAENCFYCHGQDSNKRQADLRLDDRNAAVESGAIVPGDAKSSSLIEPHLVERSRSADAAAEIQSASHRVPSAICFRDG
ncbi:MAG: c-type cytochrome domain-containing protein [Pirellulales bacterium]